MAELIEMQVAYARPDVQVVRSLSVPAGTRARAALKASDLLAEFPEIDPDRCPLGIHGREISGERVLRQGERLEVYRPLLKDPRTARREAVAQGTVLGRSGR
ncbi:MAG: RnfH family protein [Gammaproteobacteria bacterium]|nr:RnfH family protein [Gammaproteobacteria bacterium]MCP5138540.1 RnfH family protein [Chromatiales bacterium]